MLLLLSTNLNLDYIKLQSQIIVYEKSQLID